MSAHTWDRAVVWHGLSDEVSARERCSNTRLRATGKSRKRMLHSQFRRPKIESTSIATANHKGSFNLAPYCETVLSCLVPCRPSRPCIVGIHGDAPYRSHNGSNLTDWPMSLATVVNTYPCMGALHSRPDSCLGHRAAVAARCCCRMKGGSATRCSVLKLEPWGSLQFLAHQWPDHLEPCWSVKRPC